MSIKEPIGADKVLVLDGEARTALAVTRSLGRKGLEVTVASHIEFPIAGASKFASRSIRCPDPLTAPEDYLAWLSETVVKLSPKMLFPVTDASVGLALRIAPLLREHTSLPFVERVQFEEISNKERLMRIASGLGLLVPDTLTVSPTAEFTLEDRIAVKDFIYPAILKPSNTVSSTGVTFSKAPRFYVSDFNEALEVIDGALKSDYPEVSYLLQRRIDGDGVGVFLLFKDGKAVSTFCHRRILEKPPEGGVSVLSESIPEAEAPVQQAIALLEACRFQGIAMVEFKKSVENDFYLMEINPRFWGSLQLAIDCGRDFPWLLYGAFKDMLEQQQAPFHELEMQLQYRVGARLRWLLGTLDHALIRYKREGNGAVKNVFLKNSLLFFNAAVNTHFEVLRLSDIKPFFCELKNYRKALSESRSD